MGLERLLTKVSRIQEKIILPAALKATLVCFVSMALTGISASSQTFTVMNKSKAKVFYQVAGSDKNNSEKGYNSLILSVEPGATDVYKSFSQIIWSGVKPESDFQFKSLIAMYIDPSGACTTNANHYVGAPEFRLKARAILASATCGGKEGDLNIEWTSKNGNVLVTIN